MRRTTRKVQKGEKGIKPEPLPSLLWGREIEGKIGPPPLMQTGRKL